jgi:hypothetical protein
MHGDASIWVWGDVGWRVVMGRSGSGSATQGGKGLTAEVYLRLVSGSKWDGARRIHAIFTPFNMEDPWISWKLVAGCTMLSEFASQTVVGLLAIVKAAKSCSIIIVAIVGSTEFSIVTAKVRNGNDCERATY